MYKETTNKIRTEFDINQNQKVRIDKTTNYDIINVLPTEKNIYNYETEWIEIANTSNGVIGYNLDSTQGGISSQLSIYYETRDKYLASLTTTGGYRVFIYNPLNITLPDIVSNLLSSKKIMLRVQLIHKILDDGNGYFDMNPISPIYYHVFGSLGSEKPTPVEYIYCSSMLNWYDIGLMTIEYPYYIIDNQIAFWGKNALFYKSTSEGVLVAQHRLTTAIYPDKEPITEPASWKLFYAPPIPQIYYKIIINCYSI